VAASGGGGYDGAGQMYVIPGSMLTPSLRIVRPLKQGGVGNLWVCEDVDAGKPLAVKFLSEDMVRLSPEALQRFRREAKAAIALQGPHIIQTYDFGTMDDGTPYIVMELLEGESLGERLERTGALPPHHVSRIVHQVAEALHIAHDQGLVHRDIKPDNIFLVQAQDDDPAAPPFVKVLDFGTVKQIQQRSDSLLTATGMIVGTPEYMSPEQVFAAKDIDHRADIWGLGAVCFHCLTGKLPFEADSPHALVLIIASAELRPPSTVNPQLSAAVDEWFQRAMARSPTDRFDSAQEMAQAFAQVVGASPPEEGDTSDFDDEETLRFQPGIHPDPSAPDGARASIPPPSDARMSVPPISGLVAPPVGEAPPTVERALMAASQPAARGDTTHATARSAAQLRRWVVVGAAVAGAVLLLSVAAGFLLSVRADGDTAGAVPDSRTGGGGATARGAQDDTGVPASDVPTTVESSAQTQPAATPGGGDGGNGGAAAADEPAEDDALPGYASIVCIPPCDQVIVRSRALGPSPVNRAKLPPGKHEVILRRAGSPEKRVHIEVKSDQLSTHRIGMD